MQSMGWNDSIGFYLSNFYSIKGTVRVNGLDVNPSRTLLKLRSQPVSGRAVRCPDGPCPLVPMPLSNAFPLTPGWLVQPLWLLHWGHGCHFQDEVTQNTVAVILGSCLWDRQCPCWGGTHSVCGKDHRADTPAGCTCGHVRSGCWECPAAEWAGSRLSRPSTVLRGPNHLPAGWLSARSTPTKKT